MAASVTDKTGWETVTVTLVYSLYNLLLCISGIVIGAIVSRVNPRILMYLGLFLFASGWIVSGWGVMVGSFALFVLGFGFLWGIADGMLYNFNVTKTLKFFPDRKGFASGLMLGGAAIGPVFTAPLANALNASVGIAQACIIIGFIYMGLMFLIGWIVQTPPAGYRPRGWRPPASRPGSPAAGTIDKNWKQMLGTPIFWMLFLIFMIAYTPAMLMLANGAKIGAVQAGLDSSQQVLAISLLAVFNLLGRVSFGALSDKIGRYQTLFLALAILLVTVIIIANLDTPIPFMIAVCSIGACGGAVLVMFPPITSDNFGVKHSVLNYAIMFVAYSTASLLGPQLMGILLKRTKTGQ